LYLSHHFNRFSHLLPQPLFNFGPFGLFIISALKIVSQVFNFLTILKNCLLFIYCIYFLAAEKYCEILLKEIGIEYLKAFHEKSKNNKCEPLISLSKKTLEIFEKVYFNSFPFISSNIMIYGN
jgi:hypothetical protein